MGKLQKFSPLNVLSCTVWVDLIEQSWLSSIRLMCNSFWCIPIECTFNSLAPCNVCIFLQSILIYNLHAFDLIQSWSDHTNTLISITFPPSQSYSYCHLFSAKKSYSYIHYDHTVLPLQTKLAMYQLQASTYLTLVINYIHCSKQWALLHINWLDPCTSAE